jgi:NAD dependent epimerase/dehydratase
MNLHTRRVLVTGADGFIGSHLVDALAGSGAEVVALAQYNSFNHRGWLDDVSCRGRVTVVAGDVRDSHFCLELTRGVDVVFHLAALIAIPYSYSAPDSYVDTNVKGTLNICQGCLANKVGRLVHLSTSEVYGTAQYVPIDEKHPVNPQSPYSATKAGADALALSFHRSFGLPAVIARPFNTYGPRQSARAVIPTIISQIAAGLKTVRLGELSPTRDFTYVGDTCQGLIRLAEYDGGLGEVFNIGSNREISIGELFRLIAELMGSDATATEDAERLRPEASEVRRLRCDNGKLRLATGFEPSVSLREGLGMTIEWFSEEANLRKYRTDVYNV